jgi:parallel beta-helix repeat protein
VLVDRLRDEVQKEVRAQLDTAQTSVEDASVPETYISPEVGAANAACTGQGPTTGTSDVLAARVLNKVRFADQFTGNDAGEKISACIADLPPSGGICDARGLEGEQEIGSILTLAKPNVTLLTGAANFTAKPIRVHESDGFTWIGYGTTVKLADNEHRTLLAIIDSSNVRITGLILDGNKERNTTGHTLRIRAGFTSGMRASDIWLTRNIIRNGGFANLIADGTPTEPVERIWVLHNRFEGARQDNAAFEIGTRDAHFIGNICQGGIDCLSTDDQTNTGRPRRIMVSQNISLAPTVHCFDISRSDDVTVAGNICDGPTGSTVVAGYRYRDVTYLRSSGNIVRNSAADGFRVDLPNTATNAHVSLTGDEAYDSVSQGFFVYMSTSVRLTGVSCLNSGEQCIQVSDSSNVTVADSYAEGAAFNGFMFDGCSHIRIRNNTARNNGKKTAGCGSDCNGFEVNTGGKEDQADILIHGNIAYDDQPTKTQAYGLEIRGTRFDFIGLRIFGNAFGDNAKGSVFDPNNEALAGLLADNF